MRNQREVYTAVAGAALLSILAVGSSCLGPDGAYAPSAAYSEGDVPLFEVDPLWPRPLPNQWILGSTIGVSVDSRDHVWIIHRQAPFDARTEINAAADPPTAECCRPAPPVLEFDPEGILVGSWGGPGEGYDWPESNHGITVDYLDNVWIGGNGMGDSHILKFTRTGDFLMQIGSPGMRTGSNDS